MRLQGRELDFEKTGPDVSLLHFELRLLGFDISDEDLILNTFGESTREAVFRLQEQLDLESTGIVDEETARRINKQVSGKISIEQLLERLQEAFIWHQKRLDGLNKENANLRQEVSRLSVSLTTLQHEYERIKEQAIAASARVAALEEVLARAQTRIRELEALLDSRENDTCIVTGRVLRADGLPQHAVQVHASHDNGHGPIRLGSDQTDAEGRYTIRYGRLPRMDTINLRVVALGDGDSTLAVSQIIERARQVEMVDLVIRERSVVGRVTLKDGRPAEGITLRLKRRVFGGKAELLDETKTLVGGRYALRFNLDPAAASLHIVAVRPPNEEIPLVAQLNYLGSESRVTRNLIAPADLLPHPVEFQKMVDDLLPEIGEIMALADAKETADRQDLTALNRATRWDARLLAQGALAARLTKLLAEQLAGTLSDDEQRILVEAFYGLLRAGLPADRTLLAQVDPNVADAALKAVRDANIIGLNDGQIETFKGKFQTFSTGERLALPVPGGNTTYRKMLSASSLSPDAQNSFVSAYTTYGADATQLWTAAKKEGLSDQEVEKLQLQGKLAFLTSSSQEMTTYLLLEQDVARPGDPKAQLTDPAQLADLGLYTAEAWDAKLNDAAKFAEKSVDTLIPSAYVGAPEQRRKEFSEDMARKVRIGYPMQVLAHQIQNDAENAFQLGETKAPVAKILRSAAGQGFRLGMTSVDAFFDAHPGVAENLKDGELRRIKAALKDLQCTYQISPNDAVMKTMRSHGLYAANDVTSLGKEYFTDYYGHIFPSKQVADQVYRKAEQVSSMVYNLFTIANQIESQVVVYGASAPADVRQRVKNELIKHYPTLETLFGSMDFCDCEHCRSVLSPAAYLVDLLQYVEAEDAARAGFTERWQQEHNGKKYTSNYVLPYDALIKRRPDLPHIPLTCENTHTALPYIDIVNEILEYYVAHGALTPAAAHDTGEATTAELLAEPQNVIREAYETVRTARYPLTLPFDLWIETVRQFCNFAETPLAELLETFRPSDDLYAPTQPFDRAAIFIESLGLSPDEAALFTDCDPLAGGKWYELFGYATTGAVIAAPTNTAPDAKLTVPNNAPFAVNDRVTYYDASENGVQGETLSIKTIGADDSGGRGRKLITLEGLWTAPPIVGDQLIASAPVLLASAKTLSRRLGVTYKEIVEIVKTGFVNPKLVELSLLYKLGATVQDVLFYGDNRAFYEINKDLLGKARKALSPADQVRFDKLADKDPVTGLTGWEKLNRVQALLDRLNAASVEFAPFDAVAWVNKALVENAFADVLVLADPNAGCDFDATMLRYADGRAASDIDFLRINLFVRLWRKLGWTIDETDWALTTFTQKTPFTVANLGQQPLRAALLYLAHLKSLAEKFSAGKGSRLHLLTLWSDIATTGKKPLYAQLFLTRSILKSGEAEIVLDSGETRRISIFDNPLGRYLEPGGLESIAARIKDKDKEFTRIVGHLPALQGALGLTADEISQILKDDGQDPATAELHLRNVSLLYRYGLLAKMLKISVCELIALKALSGINPFEPLRDVPPTTLAEDHPYSQTLRFVEIADEIKESGLKIEDLDYLLRHQFDPTGKYRPKIEETLALLKTLAGGVHVIRTEHALPAEIATLTDEVLQQKLSLVLPPDVIQQFLAMVNGSVEFTATQADVTVAAALDPATFAAVPAIVAVSPHNVARSEQKLTYRGLLFESAQTELEAQFNNLSREQKNTLKALLTTVRQQARNFFDNQLKKQPLRRADDTGYLTEGDFSTLFEPLKPLKKIEQTDTEAEAQAKLDENQSITKENRQKLQERRARIAVAFLPVLQTRLIRQFVVQTLAAQTGAELTLVESLLTDERLLGLPPDAPTRPLIETLTTAMRGIDALFFNSNDLTGTAQASTPIVTSADTALKDKQDKDGNELGPAGSAHFEGYLEVPVAGAYRFYVILDKKDAEFTLRFDHLVEPVFLEGRADKPGALFGEGATEFIELKPGLLYHFRLEVKKLNNGEARLLVQGETLPKGPLAQLILYPASAIQGAEQALLLLTKTLQLLAALGLSEREMRYLLTHATDFADVSLSELPSVRSSDTEPEKTAAVKRFSAFLRLAAYTRLKRDLAADTDDLIAIFEAFATQGEDKLDALVYPRIAELTRRNKLVVKSAANAIFAEPTFASEEPIRRLWAALQVVEHFGVSVASLRNWTGIVNVGTSPEIRFAIAHDVRETIKARFAPETWQAVARAIFDRLRQRQRDALVAHVLHTRGFERLEQLYDYFLIDPGMEPVVQTSRIRLAIASVQLFIQRCLLNLEPDVHPSAILNPAHWEWMKRYRVWEANRKIFLFPENWLEPEFRDDKSHLFAELEGALLQGDVSRDLAEDAFLNYLRKLDELARLDIVAMHMEQKDGSGQNVLHVFGRTFGDTHKYFYRRFAAGVWSPWEPVTTEIQGDHLAPVIWRDRLYLFWVTFMEKAKPDSVLTSLDPSKSNTLPGLSKWLEAQLHWSEYLNGEWSTSESGIDESSIITLDGVPLAKRHEILVHVSQKDDGGEEPGVFIHLHWDEQTPANESTSVKSSDRSFYLASRNSSLVSKPASSLPKNRYPSANRRRATRYMGSEQFQVEFTQHISTNPEHPSAAKPQPILEASDIGDYTLLLLNHPMRLEVPKKAYEGAEKPDEVQKALENSLAETASLIEPVFFQDDTYTFFVEPTVVERTIEDWHAWVKPVQPPGHYEEPWMPWLKGQLEAYVPQNKLGVWPPEDPLFYLDKADWVINPATVIRFDDQAIGPHGGLPFVFEQGPLESVRVGVPVHVNAASAVGAAETVILQDGLGLKDVGLMWASGGLNVIGMDGANAGIMQNVEYFEKNDITAGIAGVVGR
ncbi:MAG: neuraminidase-like domain-containing protein [Caldilineaceae bacterium]